MDMEVAMVNQLVAWISSLILTASVVWKIVERYSPKIRQGLKITDETLDIINAVLDAMEDRKITKEEIENIVKQIEELQAVLQK